MALIEVDLPAPMAMRGRWAAVAAVLASGGAGKGCYADGDLWHYDDAGGNWVNLRLLPGGRAVLLGNDHEYSETYFRDAAEYFGEEETDLLAGAPAWWEDALQGHRAFGEWVGFVYGFEDGVWRRAAYDVSDGFRALNLPAVDDDPCHELIVECTDGHATAAAIAALIAADGDVDEALLGAVVPGGSEVGAGVAAARRFRSGQA